MSGFVSVALFLRLRAVAVSNYCILRCPDFPLAIFQASDYANELNHILTEFDKSFNTWSNNNFLKPSINSNSRHFSNVAQCVFRTN